MRSLSAIAVFVAAGLLVAGCGGSSEKGAKPPASKPSVTRGGLSDAGPANGKTSKGNAIQEGANGATALQKSGAAVALKTLKGSLLRRGMLTLQAPTSPSVAGPEVAGAALQGSAGQLKQGATPAQSLSKLGVSARRNASGFQARDAQTSAAAGAALQATSDASLRRNISAASALRRIVSLVKSSSVRRRLSAGVETLSAKIGNALSASSGAALRKQSLAPANALSSLANVAKAGATAGKQFQSAGVQTLEGGNGEAIQASGGATFKSAPTSSQTLNGLTHKFGAPQGQAVPQTQAGGNAVTGSPNRSKSPSAAYGQIGK